MKKHFIFLGAAGVIYYSWLLALIFVAFIVVQDLKIKWQWKAFDIYEARGKLNTYLLLALKRKKK